MKKSRMVVIEVCDKVRLTTDGTMTPCYLDLEVPEIEDLLPHVEELTLVTLTECRTTNHEWNVVFRSGFDRDHQADTPVKIGPAANSAANGSARHTAITDTSDFNLSTRLQLMSVNGSGTNIETAVVSAKLLALTVGF